MSRLSRLKIALAIGALAAFAYGVRTGDERGTWAAIALFAAAFLLRFLGPPAPPRRRAR